MRPGDHATLTRRTPLARGSVLWLDQGQRVTVVKIGERGCAVRVSGHTMVVADDALEAVGTRDSPARGGGDGDGWWDDVSGRLGDGSPG